MFARENRVLAAFALAASVPVLLLTVLVAFRPLGIPVWLLDWGVAVGAVVVATLVFLAPQAFLARHVADSVARHARLRFGAGATALAALAIGGNVQPPQSYLVSGFGGVLFVGLVVAGFLAGYRESTRQRAAE